MDTTINKSMDRFLIQLQSLKKIYKIFVDDTDKKYKDNRLGFMNILVDYKISEYESENNITSSFSDETIKFLKKEKELLLENNEDMKKIYDSINISSGESTKDKNNDECNDIEEENEEEIEIDINNKLAMMLLNNDLGEDEEESSNIGLIYKSTIINMCIALESLASDSFRLFFQLIGEEELNKKQLSYKELLEIEDIEEARRLLIDREVERIFYKSFTDWYDELDKFLKTKDEFKEIIKDILLEISDLYLKRNLFVHTDGIVNNNYLKKACNKYNKQYEVGDELELDEEYLYSSLEEVEKLGWIIYFKVIQIINKDVDKDKVYWSMINKLLKYIHNNNDMIPNIFLKISERSKKDMSKLYSKMNYYLFYKLNDRIKEVEDDLISFDVEMKSEDIRMAKSIILEKDDSLDLIKQYVSSLEMFDCINVINWPLMEIVKNKEPYKTYFFNLIVEKLNELPKDEDDEVEC